MSEQMVRVEQIRLLETKVQNAIRYIERLRTENASLRQSLESYEQRISDLEKLIGDLKTGQEEIEKGIVNALKQLDQLEDEIVDEGDDAPAAHNADSEAPVEKPLPARSSKGAGKPPSASAHPESATPFRGKPLADSAAEDERNDADSVDEPTDGDTNEAESAPTSESELDIF